MENVKALVSQKFLPFYKKWEQYLAALGYDNHCKVINATECGVPQNRERIFIFSILNNDKAFHFQEPIPLETRLKDLLEQEVDDKYVLSDQAIDGFLEHNKNHEEKGTGFIWRPKDVDFEGGGRLLTASVQAELSAQRTIPLEKSNVANCLRARASLNATDNSIVQYGKDSDSD